jgi:hypothetical protein
MTKIEHLFGIQLAYFSDKDVDSGILFSLNNCKNILNQAGVFIWNADPSKPIEMVGNEQFRLDETKEDVNYKFCSCFNIRKNLLSHIKKRLIEDGITREFIYPTTEINTWKVFLKAKQITIDESIVPIHKVRKKKRKRTNEQIVTYWLKRRRSKKTRIKRKKRKG